MLQGGKWRNCEETAEVMISDPSKDLLNSGVLMESVRIEFKPHSKSTTA